CGQFFVSLWYGQGTMVETSALAGSPHPDPHERVLLHHGEAADAGALEDARLAGDADAGAGAVEDQAVIAALQAFLDDCSNVQRRTTMAAHVVQCRDAVLPVAVEDDGLVADAAGERGLANFVGPGGDVSGVAAVHGGFLHQTM